MRPTTLHPRAPAPCAALTLLLLSPALARGVEPGPVGPLDLEQAIGYALGHHPAQRAADAAADARAAQVDEARAGYLPRLDLSAQIDDGTGNVLRGSLFPVAGLPSVSGPPTGRDLHDAALGSEVGVAVGWDALGLVRQMAEVDAALAERARARAGVDVSRLTVAYTVADQYMDVVARAEAAKAARATLERARVFATTVKALVDQQLRPGADYSRAAADSALASTQLVRAERDEALSRTALARALGAPGARVDLAASRLLEAPPVSPEPGPVSNPLVTEADAAARASQARKRAVDFQYLPRLELVGALWARGSGLTSGPVAPSPGAGALPDTPNWAVGIVLTFPVLEMIATHARTRAEAAQEQAAEARRDDVAQAVQSQIDSARETVAAARRIAENTPVALQAARDAEAQAQARYRAGLESVDLVAEAQRVLAQAELDDAVARLNVWRAELLLARAFGDLGPFVRELRGGA